MKKGGSQKQEGGASKSNAQHFLLPSTKLLQGPKTTPCATCKYFPSSRSCLSHYTTKKNHLFLMMVQIVTLLENILSHRFGENLRLQWPRSFEGKKTHCHGVAFWRAASIFLNNTGVMWRRRELYQALTHWSSWFNWDWTCVQMQIVFILLLCCKSWCLLEKKNHTHEGLDL